MSRHQRQTPLPHNWGLRLPSPVDYYSARVKELGDPSKTTIVQGQCPLHADDGTSLRVNLITGHWHCPRCGRGTLVMFHQRLIGMDWNDVVLDLIKGDA